MATEEHDEELWNMVKVAGKLRNRMENCGNDGHDGEL